MKRTDYPSLVHEGLTWSWPVLSCSRGCKSCKNKEVDSWKLNKGVTAMMLWPVASLFSHFCNELWQSEMLKVLD